MLPFATILSSGQDNLKQQLCKKNLLTVAMATGRIPIKVPFENEDLPDKENAQILMRTLYEVSYVELWLQLLLEQFLFHQFQECY